MNKKVFVAKIHWLKPNEHGRLLPIPMNNEKYCPIISVDGQRLFNGSEYSVICNNFKLIDECNTLAYVRFLNSKEAPDTIYVGSKIELFEGIKLVATGSIIEKD